MALRIGSWGLPEFGLTEKAAGFLSGGRTTDLGNAILVKPSPPVFTPARQNPPQQQQRQVSQPQGQRVSGGGYQQGGWYGNKQYWDGQLWEGGYKPNQGGGDSSSSYDDLQAQLQREADAYAGLANQSIDSMVDRVTNVEAPQARADIENEFNRAKKGSEAAVTEQAQLTTKDIGKTEDSRRSAYDEAVRYFQAANQRLQSRFGMGSSAGGAATEIATQEFYRAQGGVDKQFFSTLDDIYDRDSKVRTYWRQKDEEFEAFRKEGLAKVETNLRAALLQADQMRLQVGQNRAQMKMDLLQQAAASAQQVMLMDKQYKQNLQLAMTQNMMENQNRYGELLAQYNIDVTRAPYDSFIQNQQFNTQFTPTNTQQLPQRYVNLARRQEDELEDTNPFFA